MHSPRKIVLLTLVLLVMFWPHSFAAALNEAPSPDFVDPNTKTDSPAVDDTDHRETVIITQPPKPSKAQAEKRIEYFHSFRQALTIRLGTGRASRPLNDSPQFTLSGIQFLFPLADLTPVEAGADLLTDGSGALHISLRRIYSRGFLRPYSRFGAGLRVIPSQQLVTFLKLENYQGRAAIGAEYLIADATSVRFELEGALGIQGWQAIGTIGYVTAW